MNGQCNCSTDDHSKFVQELPKMSLNVGLVSTGLLSTILWTKQFSRQACITADKNNNNNNAEDKFTSHEITASGLSICERKS